MIVLVFTFLISARSNGGTLVSNLGETGLAGSLVGDFSGTDRRAAQAFTTGSQSEGYSLDNLTVAFNNDALGSPADIVIAMYTESNSEPDTSLGIFTGANPSSAGNYVYTPPNGFSNLAPNTTFFFVMHAEGSSNAFYIASATASDNEISSDNWSIEDDTLVSEDAGSTWVIQNNALRFEVHATPVPEPNHTMAMSAGGMLVAALLIHRKRRPPTILT